MRPALALFALGALACSKASPSSAPPAPSTWSVSNGVLRDADGRAVILRGANVSGMAKNPPWFDFHGASDFARMRTDWGMNAVRFVIEWAALEPEEGSYDDAYLDGIAQRIEWAQAASLYVVLDMHQDVYGEGFASGGGDGAPVWTCDASNYASFKPTNPWALESLEPGVTACWDGFWSGPSLQAHYAEGWRRVAARLAGYANVVGFDVMNEPYWGSNLAALFEQDQLEPFYELVVPQVRSAAPGWVAFLEPSALRNLGGTTSLAPPSFANFVYAPHSYDRNAEQGNGYDPADGPALVSNIAALGQEAQALGGALWIGEYGGVAADPHIVDYMTADYDGAGAIAASTMYWDYSKGSYGMVEADGGEAQPLLSALVRPYPERVAGDPVSYAYDAATSTFTLTYRASTTITLPTVISVPSRLYPNGYAVDCAGCVFSEAAGSLTVTTPPAGAPAVIAIHP
jgi:endoglycosylceramidase